jgi:hypothetical protein
MANIIPNSFRGALLEANHNFKQSGGNNFSLSLYVGQLIHIQQHQQYIQELEMVK